MTVTADGELVVEGDITPERVAGALVQAGYALHELRRAHISLENVFLALTANDDEEVLHG